MCVYIPLGIRPPGSMAMTPGNTLFTHNLPPLLRAATPTTPTHSYSHTLELEHRNEDRAFVPASPAAVQTLIQHVQAASSGSAVQLAGTPAAATAQTLPLTTITLPGGASGACVCVCVCVCVRA